MKIRNYFLLFTVILLCFSCTKKPMVNIVSSPEQEFSRALDFLNAKKYDKAIEGFQNIVFNFPGTTTGADAQFYLAETYFRKKDYQSAISEFEFFINSFIASEYLEEGYYKLALSYFNLAPSVGKDQVILAKTIEIIEDIEERFPETKYSAEILTLRKKVADRWAEKNYLIAKLYFKGGEYSSARVYLDYVFNEFPETRWVNWSKLLLGQIYEATDSLDQARDQYQTLLSDSTANKLKNLVQKRLQVLQPK